MSGTDDARPILRRATTEDASALAALSHELGYPTDPSAVAARLDPLLRALDHQVLVAEIDGGVVGWAHAFTAIRIETEPFVELGGLVVAEAHRGRGVGRTLVRAAEAWAADRGLYRLRIRSNTVRSDAHAFYAALGYERAKTQAVFTRMIDAA